MASKNFLLVSLEESKAKQLAQVVSNDVCRRILDYLAAKEKHATETEIAKDLGIALSTVHYNLKQLLQSGIVKAEEFHYSEKGREVNHYSLANKYIIIAPKATATESLANKLKRILPVVGIVAATGMAIRLFSTFRQAATGFAETSYYTVQKVAEEGVQKAAEKIVEAGVDAGATVPAVQEAGKAAAVAIPQIQQAAGAVGVVVNATAQPIQNETAVTVIEKVTTQIIHSQQNIALWFVVGAVFALATYMVYDVLRDRLKQR